MYKIFQNNLNLNPCIKIGTKNILPKFINDKNGRLKPLKIRKSEDLLNILPYRERVQLLLTLNKKPLTTKEITTKLNAQARTIRQILAGLEKDGLVYRTKGKAINKDFRFSDIWQLNKKFDISKYDKSLYLWFESKHHNNKTIHYILLPKFLNIDEDFVKVIGLLDAEKTKFDSKRVVIEFVNSEPEIVKLVLKFFTELGLSKSEWNWRLIFNKKLKLKKQQIELIKSFWIYKLNMNEYKEYNMNFIDIKGKLRKKNILGSISISYNNLLLNNIITNMQEFIKNKIVMKGNKFMYAYLNGYFSGEAYVGDRQIQVASKDSKQFNYVKDILERLGVKVGIGSETINSPQRLLISKVEDFIKFYENDIFDINPNKRKNLIERLLRYQNRYKLLINSEFIEKLEIELKSTNMLLKKRMIFQ